MAQRYIYLSEDLNNKLKEEDNASALIQKLLTEHYKEHSIDTMSKEQLIKAIKIAELKEEMAKKIKELEIG